jgi:4-hydroxy-3-polyprenylbenzoate decarboxylase
MRLIVGISGASGVLIGIELLKILREIGGCETHLVISSHAAQTINLETNYSLADVKSLASLSYPVSDISAAIASGSFLTAGMVIVPCSMNSLAGVAHGLTDNLLLRAADVCLKEGRKLVLVPRETPFSRIHLRNLTLASEAGCMIMPPMMTFYNRPETIQEMIDHFNGKILLQFGLHHPRFKGWKENDGI